MNEFATFLISFCSVSVLIGGLYMLCPKGTMNSSVKYILCLIFLCCILHPIINIKNTDIDVKFSDFKPEISEDAAELSVRLVFAEALKNADIEFSKITVCTDKNDDGSIIINEVIVYSSFPPETVIEVLGNSDEYEVKVINE